MEFLEHIRKLDELENSRQVASKKAINSDFVYYNGQIQAENQDKKDWHNAQKRADKYNYFPFVSGELIEKHRATLGAQLKNDLQSYLDYSKNSQARNTSAAGSFNDGASVKSFLKTGPPSHYSQNRARAVKELFDSDYVKPSDNFRVFQDSNPVKVAAHKEALERFEGKLKKESQLAGVYLTDHQRRINFDQNEKDREVDEKVNKQKLFKDQIQEQMRLNEELRAEHQAMAKVPISTGFTPESPSGEAQVLFLKKKDQQQMVKTLLQKQMTHKSETDKLEKQAKINFESEQIADNHKNIEILKENRLKDKQKAKNHWLSELQRSRDMQDLKPQEV